MLKISSPMAGGNGAAVVHSQLEKCIKNYAVNLYSPRYEYAPFLIRRFSDRYADIVHTTADYGIIHSRKYQKLIVTLHNYVLDKYMWGYSTKVQQLHYRTDLKLFTKLSLQRADKVTAVSHFTAKIARSDVGYTGDIIVIPNGVDESMFKPQKRLQNRKNLIKVLFSGNLTIRKGAQWLNLIADRLVDGVELVYTSGLRSKVRLPEHPKLRNIGLVPHEMMPDLYRKVDILLMPSVREGLSMAALEAMASGLPVVATDCSSFSELVINGEGGYLCNVGDIKMFADKINTIASSRKIRDQMGEHNRSLIQDKYTQNRMISDYNRLFDSL